MGATRSTAASARFRARKLLPKHPLQVLREDQIESDEYKELLEQLLSVETGVEKSEENEYHLQQALAAALGRGSKTEASKIVPAPPAEETKAIDYDVLYSSQVPKTSSYIRFSETVEESTGCPYDMTSEDDSYLSSFNQSKPASSQCSEDDFEKIMAVFELTADRQAPFAAVDNTVVGFDLMEVGLKHELREKARLFAKDIYEYWKTRRQSSGNKALQPSLKFEIHQDNDDGDPYVCFRRRDVRQTRKTRARDIQFTEKLRQLRKELEEGREVVIAAHEREEARQQQLAADRKLFETRSKVKEIRHRIGIRVDDDDLVNQKPQKKKPVELPPVQRTSSQPIRLPARPDGRPIESDLTLLSDILSQKENIVELEIEQKLQQHQRWNKDYVDMTREPLSPVHNHNIDMNFRVATTEYLMTPPASADEADSPSQEDNDVLAYRFSSPSEEPESRPQFGYRRRIGRLGRLWIDRRGLPSSKIIGNDDRFKYDQDDDDDEPPVYGLDPNAISALKFRASITYSANVHSGRRQPQEIAAGNSQGASGASSSPPSRPANSSTVPNHLPS